MSSFNIQELLSGQYEILKELPIDALVVNPDHCRIHDIEAIKRSVIKNGFLEVIICDESMVILAGNGRWKALKELGAEKVPLVIKRYGLTERQKKDFLLSDNKTAELADWDVKKLFESYDRDWLKDIGFDILMDNIAKDPSKYRLGFEVNRNMDFMVVFFDKPEDFSFVREKFGLEEVVHPKNREIGLCRLIEGKKLIEVMK